MQKNTKSCMTRGILLSVKKKSKIYNKFCQAKDPERKKSLHEHTKNTKILQQISQE